MENKTNTAQGILKKPYVQPEFEVIELDSQAPLLTASGNRFSSGPYNGGELDDD